MLATQRGPDDAVAHRGALGRTHRTRRNPRDRRTRLRCPQTRFDRCAAVHGDRCNRRRPRGGYPGHRAARPRTPRRRSRLAASQAENLTSHPAARPDDARELPRILVLIDSYGGLLSAFADRGGGFSQGLDVWLEMIQAVITDGRQVGIHTVITAGRRDAIPSRLHASISNRLILRQADETSHSEHGIPTVRPLSTPTRSCNRPERAYRCAQASTWCQAATCSSPTVNPPCTSPMNSRRRSNERLVDEDAQRRTSFAKP